MATNCNILHSKLHSVASNRLRSRINIIAIINLLMIQLPGLVDHLQLLAMCLLFMVLQVEAIDTFTVNVILDLDKHQPLLLLQQDLLQGGAVNAKLHILLDIHVADNIGSNSPADTKPSHNPLLPVGRPRHPSNIGLLSIDRKLVNGHLLAAKLFH